MESERDDLNQETWLNEMEKNEVVLKGMEICEKGKEGMVNSGEMVGIKVKGMLKAQDFSKGLKK